MAQAAWQTASQQAQALTAKLTTITSQHTAQAETLRQAQRQLAAAQQADTAQADLSAKLTELQHQGKNWFKILLKHKQLLKMLRRLLRRQRHPAPSMQQRLMR
ncbi:chromosome partition protein [Lacticaseibacillus casei 21/1]|nr:chromosome partition protein [Lacticaseibacillus casei 21/1]